MNDLFSFFFQSLLSYIHSTGIQKNMFMKRDIEAPPFSVKPQYIGFCMYL